MSYLKCWSIGYDPEKSSVVLYGFTRDNEFLELNPITYFDYHNKCAIVDGKEYDLGVANEDWISWLAKRNEHVENYQSIINKN